MNSIIQLKNISFFNNKELVLKDVSFDIKEKEALILTGPNGGGKSTIGNLIFGNLKPSSGEIIKKSGLKMSIAMQKLLIPKTIPITVEKFLQYCEKQSIYKQIYDAFEIDSIKNQQMSELSGGQLQKVNLCNAIRNNMDFIILDEPDQYLDFKSQEMLYKILIDLSKTTAMLIITHDMHIFGHHFNHKKMLCVNQKIHCGDSFEKIHSHHCVENC